MLRDWPAMLLVVGTTVVSSGLIGLVLGRSRALPPPVAAWGVAPGGAAAMVAMSQASGADVRLVATFQYIRLICVVIAASAISRMLLLGYSHLGTVMASVPAAAGGQPGSVATTLIVAAAAAWLAPYSRIPAGGLLLPMVAGASLQTAGLVDLSVPTPVTVLANAAIGWWVGLRFTRDTLRVAIRIMPQILLASAAMIALGGMSAWLLASLRHTDPLTAFPATTPGGIDSVALIAIGANVDLPFVMALQALRVFVVVLTGAPMARLIERWSARD